MITPAAQKENIPKNRQSREIDPTDVRPQDIVERFSREIKNVGSKANRVESVQVKNFDHRCSFGYRICVYLFVYFRAYSEFALIFNRHDNFPRDMKTGDCEFLSTA